jgi:hypothetical protein
MAKRKSPKLTSRRRRKLPKARFALPGSRKYPVDTPGRAANAKARATQQYKKGRISASTKARIHAKANAVLRKKRSGGKRRRKR